MSLERSMSSVRNFSRIFDSLEIKAEKSKDESYKKFVKELENLVYDSDYPWEVQTDPVDYIQQWMEVQIKLKATNLKGDEKKLFIKNFWATETLRLIEMLIALRKTKGANGDSKKH